MSLRPHTVFGGLLLLLTFGLAPAYAQPTDPQRETEAIAQVIRETTEAFSAHDAERFATFYTPTATLVTVRGERMNGTEEIVRGLSSIFATRARKARLQNLETSVAFLTPDVAVAHVLNELSGVLSPDGDVLPPHQELSIRVFVKNEGVWRVTAFHNTIVQAKPEAKP